MKLFIGAEGTLGIVTEGRLAHRPRKYHYWLSFQSDTPLGTRRSEQSCDGPVPRCRKSRRCRSGDSENTLRCKHPCVYLFLWTPDLPITPGLECVELLDDNSERGVNSLFFFWGGG